MTSHEHCSVHIHVNGEREMLTLLVPVTEIHTLSSYADCVKCGECEELIILTTSVIPSSLSVSSCSLVIVSLTFSNLQMISSLHCETK